MSERKPIVLTEEELTYFVSLLTDRTGIVPRASHIEGIRNFLENYLHQNKLSVQQYKDTLLYDKALMENFINECTVNETYFFREEKQFMFLKDKIFPKWRSKVPGGEIKMWSAACSYGEEAYSFAILAKTLGLKPIITATDINSEVLEHCKAGLFLGTSLRAVDGVAFQNLVLPFRRSDGRVEFSDEIRSCVKTMQMNLAEIDSPFIDMYLPRNQNIIFIRNVFIYFTPEMRARILRTIAQKCLADDGLLFVSMSETAQIDSTILPPSLEKQMDGSVFYFHKKTTGGKVYG